MHDPRKGYLLAFLGCIASSAFLVSYKVAAAHGAAADAVFVLILSAAVLNSVTSLAQNGARGLVPRDRASVTLAVALAVLTLSGNLLAGGAVARISAPLTSVLQQTQILFVAFLGWLLFAERLTPRFWLGTLVAGAGASLLQLSPSGAAAPDGLGMAMAIASAASFGAMATLTHHYIHRIRPVAVNALRLWIAILLWFVIERRLPSFATKEGIVASALAGAFGPFLSRMAIMYSLRYLPPTRTTLIGLVTPVITLAPAFAVFSTVPSARELVGAAVMIAGIALPLTEDLRREGVV